MTFKIDDIKIYLEQQERGVRIKTENDNVFLQNQTLEETKTIVEKNYEIVKKHFLSRVETKINLLDLKQICFKIVLYYLYMYNLWRSMYEREKHRDLTFLYKDFDHPQTNDIIIQFFKEKYPNSYSNKCEVMLDMSPEKFRVYEKNRQDFYNMF